MNLKDIDLNLLLVFDAIYVEESISKAADKLGITQPAMSNALKRLRNTLGDPLFVRSSGTMLPTPRAEDLAEPIRESLQIINSAVSKETDFDFSSATNSFGIAMSDYGEAIIVPKLLQYIEKNAPGIKLRLFPIEGGDLGKALTKGKIDIAIGRIPFLDDGFRCQRLLEEKFVCLVRDEHPEIKEKLCMEQFAKYPHIIFTPRKEGKTFVEKKLSEIGLCREAVIHSPNTLSVPIMVSNTNYIAFSPYKVAKKYASMYKLKIFDPPFEMGLSRVNQYWHERMHNFQGHKWIRSVIHSICQDV